MVTAWSPRAPSWSPHGHRMVTAWSPHDRLVVASWSPRGHLYGDPPRPLSVFWGVRWTPMGGLGGSHTYIYFQRYLTPK